VTVNPLAGDKNLELKNNMEGKHPTWNLGTPVSGGCSLNATDNVQGRLMNGVPAANVCSTAASSYTGQWLSIEQDPGFRTASDWIPSVSEVWGAPATPPPAPANLQATGGDAQVSLSWTAAQGATTYNANRSIVSGGPYSTIQTGITATNYLDTTVANGTTYFYTVSGQNAAGEGPDSNQASATPQTPQLPPAPTGVAATSPSKKKITVTWNAVPGATSYRVKRSTTSGGPYTVVGSPTTNTFTNTGLTSGTTYYYVVSAVNGSGEGPNSVQVSAVAK
jgi:fibronectin type 3 domain-containing protein